MLSPRSLRNLKRELSRSALAKTGIVLIVLVVGVAVFAPLVAPHDPTAQNLDRAQLPPLGFSETTNTTSTEMVNGSVRIVNETKTINATAEFPLGTDSLGRGMLSRVVYGARTSLLVGLFGTRIAGGIGVGVG
ncbi:ABC transporter permease, partial [Halobium palmae]